MTVLMTADTVGGVWTYAIDLARALGPRGVDVVLATMGRPLDRAQRREAAAIRGLEVVESRYRLEWMPDPWKDVAAAGTWLLDLERRWSPAVVHLNGYAHGALPFAAPVLIAAHSCVLSWWHAVRGDEPPASWQIYRRAVARGLDGARQIVAPTRAMANSLRHWYAPRTPVRVIPNGRDARCCRLEAKTELILTAGRLWDEAKNVGLVGAAAPGVPWPVYVAGDADGGDLPAAVTHLGRLDATALAGWYAKAAIYALPARYEPFGLSALEAALSGCALVLGDIPSLREVWGRAATFVDPDDPAHLGEALRELIAAPRRLMSMSVRARARARRYSLDSAADTYRAMYGDLARSSRAHTRMPACAS